MNNAPVRSIRDAVIASLRRRVDRAEALNAELLRELKEAQRGLEMAIRGIESPDFRESCQEFLPSISGAIAKSEGGDK